MKQNLQTPATPLEMLSLFLPAGLLDYFDLVNHVSQETCFIFFLEEKPGQRIFLVGKLSFKRIA